MPWLPFVFGFIAGAGTAVIYYELITAWKRRPKIKEKLTNADDYV